MNKTGEGRPKKLNLSFEGLEMKKKLRNQGAGRPKCLNLNFMS